MDLYQHPVSVDMYGHDISVVLSLIELIPKLHHQAMPFDELDFLFGGGHQKTSIKRYYD